MGVEHLVVGEWIALDLVRVPGRWCRDVADFFDSVDDRSGELDMQEEGVTAAAAGHLHDQFVVVVANLAELRPLVVTAAHAASVVTSLGPQELQDGIFHRRPVQYRTGEGASLMAESWQNR